jgi:hypothetical protein
MRAAGARRRGTGAHFSNSTELSRGVRRTFGPSAPIYFPIMSWGNYGGSRDLARSLVQPSMRIMDALGGAKLARIFLQFESGLAAA